jgi:putative membrane protein
MDVVLFMVMPGETQHFTLRIGTEDFSFNGYTFMVQPATLAQLDQIADLRDAKDDLEDSYNAITDSLDIILNSLDGMDSKLVSTADGLDQLNSARATLSAGKNRVYDEADKALASMTDLSDSLSPVVSHLQTAKDALAETTTQLTALTGSVDDLRPEVQDLRTSLTALRKDLDTLDQLLQDTKVDSKKLSKQLAAIEDDLEDLQDDMDDVSGDMGTLSTAIGKLNNKDYSVDKITVNGKTPDEIRALHTEVESTFPSLLAVYQAMGGEDFSDTEAGFVKFYTTEATRSAAIQAMAAQTAASAVAGMEDGDQKTATYNAAFDAAKAQYEAKLTAENVTQMAYLHYEWTSGDNIQSKLEDADTFNTFIDQYGSSIDGAVADMKSVSKPAKTLLDSLQTLMDNANDGLLDDSRSLLTTVKSMLDRANDYDTSSLHTNVDSLLATTDSLLGKTDTVLEQSKALSDTVTKYEPSAQQALDDAKTQVNSAVGLLNDLNSFTKTFENLMKAADTDLDQGAQKSLTGLSSSLRQMASGLGATDSIRTANNSIESLIEDKWNEYTGEDNNLLNMDSNATMVSLTSEENQTPNSIQLVLRSQEIKVDEDAKAAEEAASQTKTTFWGRVTRMFKDFVAIFTGDE